MIPDYSKLEDGWYWKHLVTRGGSSVGGKKGIIHYYHKGKALCNQVDDYEIKLTQFKGLEKKKCKLCRTSLNTYKDLNNIVERKEIVNG